MMYGLGLVPGSPATNLRRKETHFSGIFLPHKSIANYNAPAPAQLGITALETTKAFVATMCPLLPSWALPLSKLPRYCYLQCSCLWPGGTCRPRNYQSMSIYNVPALGNTKLSLFKVFLPQPKEGLPRSHSKRPWYRYVR